MASIAQLFVEFGIDAGDWSKNIKEIQREAKELEKSLRPTKDFLLSIGTPLAAAGTAIVGGLTAATKAGADYADQIRDVSIRTGIATEDISKLAFAASQSGSDIQDISAGLKAFAKDVSSNSKAFESLGVAATDATGKARPLIDILADTADVFAGIEDPIKKAALAQDLFGKSGVNLTELLSAGSAGIRQMGNEATRLGLVVGSDLANAGDEFNDTLGKIKGSLLGVSLTIAESLLPILTPIANAIGEAVIAFQGWAKEHPVLIQGLLAIGAALAGAGGLILGIAGVLAILPSLGTALAVVGDVLLFVGATVATLFTPFGLVATAVTAFGAAFVIFPEIRAAVIEAVNVMINVFDEFWRSNKVVQDLLTEAWAEIRTELDVAMAEIASLIREGTAVAFAIWSQWGPQIKHVFEFIVKTVIASIGIFIETVTTGIKVITGGIQAFHGLITGDVTKFSQGLQRIWQALWDAIKNAVSAPLRAIEQSVTQWTAKVSNAFKSMYEAVVGHSFVPDMMSGIRDEFGRLDEVMVRPTQNATDGVLSSFKNMFDTVLGFAQDWKGSLKKIGEDILEGFNLKEILKGDFGSILDSVKGTFGIGGTSGGKGGGIGGLLGGGGSAAAGAGSLLTGIGALSGFVTPIANLFGQIGQGRKAADEIVKSQNAFGDAVARLLEDSSLTAQGKSNIFETMWSEFQGNLARFAATDPNNQKVANQAFATLSPFVADVRAGFERDLSRMTAVTPAAGAGTVNAPFTLHLAPVFNFDGEITALTVRDDIMPEITVALESGVRGYLERWKQLLTDGTGGTVIPVGI